MKRQFLQFTLYSILFFIFCAACNVSGPKIFERKGLHAAYGDKLSNAGLKNTALGRSWFNAADKALTTPVSIKLPYKEKGYFPNTEARSVGLSFSPTRGEKVIIQLFKNPLSSFTIYADLWKIAESGKQTYLTTVDTATYRLEYDISDEQQYILRLQPELLQSGDFTLSISVGPTLAYPIKSRKPNIGSLWGDNRDAGARKHEGIDLFAPLRTPAIAAADGIITRVNENNLGGKVIWLHPFQTQYSLYYAHLDEQLVKEGSRVKTGDTVGLIGNTGNARTTSPHLHFGIYTGGGAINPLPFVNPQIKDAKDIKGFEKDWNGLYRTSTPVKKKIDNKEANLSLNTIVQVLAVNGTGARIKLPDNSIAEAPLSALKGIDAPIKKMELKFESELLESPLITAPKMTVLSKSDAVNLLGYFEDFYFVEVKNMKGWICKKSVL